MRARSFVRDQPLALRTMLAKPMVPRVYSTAVRGVLARWILLATAAAFMLLGRPTEDVAAPRSDDEQASRGAGDDVSFRSERRPSTVIRMVGYDLDDDGLSVDLDTFGNDVSVPLVVRRLTPGSSERQAPDERLPSSSSARGPPAIRT
jgi:hypothetical protein